jgi:DNA-binding NarL/FixJ family response regulator
VYGPASGNFQADLTASSLYFGLRHNPYQPLHSEVELIVKSLVDRTRKLSPRQQRVAELVALGLKNPEIATTLGIGVHVVRNYLTTVYDKVGVSNRVELALWYEARRHETRKAFMNGIGVKV